jgi:hypothetical protein
MKTKNSKKNMNTLVVLAPKQMGKITGGNAQLMGFIVK